ncbi:uncharacterized protein C11orf24 [Coregonus clupeaformis]|uniref:uncharacterized protein C11orf24 n=1 Tax=Coregonus clupeaformis TaxID=59861 RepID=UPI001BDFA59D|nr:uncharacterized protein C11orf24 [Coregonus clupeaformis]XP_041693119.1 uncharacterized protein C11orf24 [Coregonus clupeaformis]XP_041693120.1 uncharacterized protein C11orf24 [Coregonus clupeaformis]XP_041693121.1 uncharacterized protein C11orf24 [Coregonus clupeaformis]XP_041693123.1 uncharacterized protein C11orf24 [Coregonus clupeaformis]XP_041693124.1 uncharacterized protein C11orf24 [Coregonus clupeaformis]
MTLHPLLFLSPILGLLVLPCLSSHVASQFSIVASRTMTEQTQCSEACSLNTACDHAFFRKEKSTCFFLTCPNGTNCNSISVADLIRKQDTDIRVFKRETGTATQSSNSSSRTPSELKNPTAHKLSNNSDDGQAPTVEDSAVVSAASTMTEVPMPAPKDDAATTVSDTKGQSPVTTTATSVKLESTTVRTPKAQTTSPAIPQITTTMESETTTTTTTTTTTAMPSTTNTTTTQPTTTTTTIPSTTTTTTTTATPSTTNTTTTQPTTTTTTIPSTTTTTTTIKTTALPSTTTPKTTTTTTTTADTSTDEEKKPSPTIPEAPSTRVTSRNSMVPSTATAEVGTKRLDGGTNTNRAIIDVVAGEILTRQLVDTSALLAVLLFGLLFFLVTVVLFLTQAYKSYRRKDYTQVDYLINGMYSDSGV